MQSIDSSAERFLVIGGGSIARRHVSNLQRLGITTLAIVETSTSRQNELSRTFGVHVFPDLDCGLDWAPTVALVCTPTSLHLEHALAAARAGCHLFIEKPIAHTLEGLAELLEEVAERHLKSLVGCNFRFHPGLAHTKDLLESEAIGRVVSARATFGHYLPDWHPWEDYRRGYSARRELGGGVILDRIHEIDYLMWLLGDVRCVFAMAGHLSHIGGDTEDTAELLIEFVGGTLGSVHLDYVRRTYDCRLEVTGDEGSILWSYPDNEVKWYCARDGEWKARSWPNLESNSLYLAEMRHLLAVVTSAESSRQDCSSALRPLQVAIAAKASAASGRRMDLSNSTVDTKASVVTASDPAHGHSETP